MFDTLDGWYGWLAVTVAATALFAVALAIPAASPPDATSVATAIDDVAASDYAGTTTQSLDADAVRLTPRSVALRGQGGTARAALKFGRIVPVHTPALRAVLDGQPPRKTFESSRAFADAVEAARTTTPEWETAPETLRVRHVIWGGVDVTLVG